MCPAVLVDGGCSVQSYYVSHAEEAPAQAQIPECGASHRRARNTRGINFAQTLSIIILIKFHASS